MKRCTEKSPSSTVNRNNIRTVLTVVSLLVASALMLGTASYAWFAASKDRLTVDIDTKGVSVTAALAYSDALSSNIANPRNNNYVLQNRRDLYNIDDNITGDSVFRGGNSIVYRMTVINNTDLELLHTANGDTAEKSATVRLSFNNLNAYYFDAVEEQLAGDSNGVRSLIIANSGVILMKLEYVKYSIGSRDTDTNSNGIYYEGVDTRLDAGNAASITDYYRDTENLLPLNTYDGFDSANTLSQYYGDGNDFFSVSLAPGQVLTVYFSIICMSSADAVSAYRTYREAIIDSLPTETAEQQARKEAYRAVLASELGSLVIEKTNDAGQGATTSVQFHIKYISVFAEMEE